MRSILTLIDIDAQFRGFLNQQRHPLYGALPFDQANHYRYQCPYAKNKRNKHASCKAHSDGRPTIKFYCHYCGFGGNFSVNQPIGFTKADKRKWQAQKSQLRHEEISEQQQSIQDATTIWADATPCLSHNYLTHKNVQISEADDLRVSAAGALLLPIRLITSVLISYQRIFWDNAENKFKKRFHRGASINKGFHILGTIDDHDVIYFAEGLATCLTIRESTQQPVVCVYGKRFHEVAPIIARAYPGRRYVFCIDHPNDREITTRTRSEDSAKKAIRRFGGLAVLPNFNELKINDNEREVKKLTDFNDLFVEMLHSGLTRTAALAEVQLQLTNSLGRHRYDSKIRRQRQSH